MNFSGKKRLERNPLRDTVVLLVSAVAMPSLTSTLFISAVTDEFGSYRAAVARFLDLPGTRIEVQEKFVAAGQTMLVKLSDYIKQCDAVVHLVGDRSGNQYGGIANPADLENLLDALPTLPQALRLDAVTMSALSYTQWEAWLAIFHRRKLFIAVAESSAPRDSALVEAPEAARQRESQRAHLEALATKEGRFPETRFGNSDQLCLGLVPLRDAIVGGSKIDLAVTNILSLADYRAGLGGFRRFLSSEYLPFQAPPPGTPSHPEELLKRIETSDDGRGVLLAGVGGVGKTRTTFETAQLAESQGWRVLYVLPGQPPATTEKIMGAVLASGPGKTMVVIEYMDQMHELDLGVLRRHVIQLASRLGIRFGLIANCRPGWLLKARPERDITLETVTLDLSAIDASRLSSYVADYTAPMALQSVGEKELMRLCGHRPIIALLVAQQLEQLAKASKLYLPELAVVRSGDLAHWLRRRLAEDGLIVPEPDSQWSEALPPSHLVAAAAVLACSPDEKTSLIAAAASALENMNQSPSTAARVVSVLVSAGWLERQGPWLYAVHDVVSDEVVEQVSFELDAIRPTVLAAVLSPAICRGRSVGQMVKTLTRVEGALSPAKAELLRDVAAKWLRDHAEDLGTLLADAEPSTGSYALGSLLGGSIFEDAAVEYWPTLVAPWLEEHKTRYEARHLLHRGLRSRHDRAVDELVSVAMAWLENWLQQEGASFVLQPLLERTNLKEESLDQATSLALEWVECFKKNENARFVLQPLLDRADLKQQSAEQATSLALEWVECFKHNEDAMFVLRPLLERTNLEEESANRAIELALEWLERFNKKDYAQFVLHSLLSRWDLKGEPFEQAILLALEWLESSNLRPGSDFVLKRLLGRSDLKGEEDEKAIALALEWLERSKQNEDARFVLRPLLERANLKEEQAKRAVALALEWLDGFSKKDDAGFTLNSLLYRGDLKGEPAKHAITLALGWLESSILRPGSDFVLKVLLDRADLIGEADEKAIALALEWLERSKQNEDAMFVLRPLLERTNLKEEQAERAVALAAEWLERFNKKDGAEFTLNALLSRGDLKGEPAEQAITLGLGCLEPSSLRTGGDFVLKRLLGREDLREEAAEKATVLALGWLAHNSESQQAQFVLRPLLGRANLKGNLAEEAFNLALQWLVHFSDKQDAQFVFRPLLDRADLKGDPAQRAIALALEWLGRFSLSVDSGFVLKRLLDRADLEEGAIAQTVDFALQWLTGFGRAKRAGFVLTSLLRFVNPTSTGPSVAASIQTMTSTWIQAWGRDPEASFVLVECLLSGWSAIAGHTELSEAADRWATLHEEQESGGPAISIRLSLCPDTDPEAIRLVDSAERWIDSHLGNPGAANVLRALLAKHPEDERIREFVVDRGLNLGRSVGGIRVRTLLSRSKMTLTADNPRRNEIEVLLDQM